MILNYYTGLPDSVQAVDLGWFLSLGLWVYFGFPGLSFGNLGDVGVPLLSASICPWLFCTTTWLPGHGCGLSSVGQCLCATCPGLLEGGAGHSGAPMQS